MDDHDYGCCARTEGHDGPCAWHCSDCNGLGTCPLCIEDCNCDDVVACDWCEGTHACPAGCFEGWIEEVS